MTTHVQQRRQIRSINKQLIEEFHPAVKNVTAAGQNLIRSYGELNKAFYTYTASLYALSYSGRDGEPATQALTEQILHHAETMKRLHTEQQAWVVDYFAKMILLIGHNNGTEKDRLRALMYTFSKKERELTKAVNKKKVTPTEMDTFYEEQHTAMADQQIQRYKFFADKHLEIIRRQMDSYENVKHIVLEREDLPVLETREVQTSVIDVAAEDEQSHLDELVLHAEAEQQRLEAAVVERTHSSGRLAQRTEALYGSIVREELVENGGGSVKKKVFPPSIYTPTPLVAVAQQQQAVAAVERHNSNISHDESLVVETHRASHQSMLLTQKQRGSPPKPASYMRGDGGGIKRHSLVVMGASEHNNNHHYRSSDGSTPARPLSSSVVMQQQQRISSVASPFSASNYGELLECTTTYTAQGENQLTMEIGDRMILVKCGSRGWLLGRSVDGTRQGWFPSKFLKRI